MSKQYKFLFSPPDGIHFMILSGENLDGFRVLLSELRQQWVPSGPDEEDCILEMAKAIWGKRRHQRFLQARGADATCDPEHKAYDEVAALDALTLIGSGAAG